MKKLEKSLSSKPSQFVIKTASNFYMLIFSMSVKYLQRIERSNRRSERNEFHKVCTRKQYLVSIAVRIYLNSLPLSVSKNKQSFMYIINISTRYVKVSVKALRGVDFTNYALYSCNYSICEVVGYWLRSKCCIFFLNIFSTLNFFIPIFNMSVTYLQDI